MIEVEFGWVVGWVGWGGVQSHNHVKPNSVEVVLRLSWGCDNIFRLVTIVRSWGSAVPSGWSDSVMLPNQAIVQQ